MGNDQGRAAIPVEHLVLNEEYVGTAFAEFADYELHIQGPAHVQIDELGNVSVEVTVDIGKVQIAESEIPILEHSPSSNLLWFLTGYKHVSDGTSSAIMMTGGGSAFFANKCVRLTIVTETGSFTATGVIDYGYSDASGDAPIITFSPSWLQWDASHADIGTSGGPSDDIDRVDNVDTNLSSTPTGAPFYWVLFLQNYVSDFPPRNHRLESHPMLGVLTRQIEPTSEDNDGPPTMPREIWAYAPIPFEFEGKVAFIEPVPTYGERVERLNQRQEYCSVTAVMVGEVGVHSTDYAAAVRTWFPFDILPLLGFVTGTEVGSPGMDFYDQSGSFVKRLVMKRGSPDFRKGYRVIVEAADRGTGSLLTSALKSHELNESYLRVALKQMTKAGPAHQPLEDRVVHLFRALDTLCTGYHLYPSVRAAKLLEKEDAETLEEITKFASKLIRRLAARANRDGRIDHENLLNKVADRIKTAPVWDVGFGEAVERLLDKFGLPDAQIADAYCRDALGARWTAILGRYRGTPVHQGYFDLIAVDQLDKQQLNNIVMVTTHLHDVMLRIILKIVGYTGTYQPKTFMATTIDRTLDWVTPATSPQYLGFGRQYVR